MPPSGIVIFFDILVLDPFPNKPAFIYMDVAKKHSIWKWKYLAVDQLAPSNHPSSLDRVNVYFD